MACRGAILAHYYSLWSRPLRCKRPGRVLRDARRILRRPGRVCHAEGQSLLLLLHLPYKAGVAGETSDVAKTETIGCIRIPNMAVRMARDRLVLI